MRKLAIAVALTSLSLVTACGGDSGSETNAASGDAGSTQAESSTEASTEASTAPSASASAGSDSSGGGGTLIASVGEQGDPDAFTITLTDESGQPVSSVPAGTYEIQVNDPSTIHNFHLRGGSGVEESTTVPEQVETTWTVDLQPGDYTYVCDPHPRMTGSFSVT